jgi:regulator of vacuolar morphogenesis
MPDKRKTPMSAPAPKRPRIHEDASDEVTSHEQPRSHPVYGQKNAFPGLDDAGDELFYGPADDGLEYLRMVR